MITITVGFYLVICSQWDLKCDHVKRLITLISDNIKRLSLYLLNCYHTRDVIGLKLAWSLRSWIGPSPIALLIVTLWMTWRGFSPDCNFVTYVEGKTPMAPTHLPFHQSLSVLSITVNLYPALKWTIKKKVIKSPYQNGSIILKGSYWVILQTSKDMGNNFEKNLFRTNNVRTYK